MKNDTHYISKEGLEKLKAELEDFEKNQRPAVAERIQRAKEFGDLSENAEYADAKDEQAYIEGKIVELRTLVQNAIVIDDSKKSDGTVRVGSSIKVQFDEQGEKDFTIVGSREADPIDGKISNESPMGGAFIGHKVGDVVEIDVPRGKIRCTILQVD